MTKMRNYFAASVVFSAFWHFLWISAIGINVEPNEIMRKEYTEVSFLGPILEKTAFEMMLEESSPKAETLYRPSVIVKDEAYLDVEGPGRSLKDKAFENEMLNKKQFVGKIYLSMEKEKPSYNVGEKRIYYHIEEKALNRFIEGPAKQRVILFKPDMPYFTKRSLTEEKIFITRFKILISDRGDVEKIEPIISSGDPAIDLKCRAYLKQWKFVPRDSDDVREKEWGIITLNIEVK